MFFLSQSLLLLFIMLLILCQYVAGLLSSVKIDIQHLALQFVVSRLTRLVCNPNGSLGFHMHAAHHWASPDVCIYVQSSSVNNLYWSK
jgi:hypothetical protein